MYWTDISAGNLDSATKKIWGAFGADASRLEHTLTLEPSFADRMANWARQELKWPANFDLAREIMGKNFFGPKEAIEHFGVTYGLDEQGALRTIPFTAAVLEECKYTHVLVAVFPLSIMEIRQKEISRTLVDQSWYVKKLFANQKGEKAAWHLVLKGAFPPTVGHPYHVQKGALLENEKVPEARVVVYTAIGHFKATGKRLFDRSSVRCHDLASEETGVIVEHIGHLGLHLEHVRAGQCTSSLGLAAERRPSV